MKALWLLIALLTCSPARAEERQHPGLDAWAGAGFQFRQDAHMWSAAVDIGIKDRPLYLSVDVGSYIKQRDLETTAFDGPNLHNIRVHSSNRVVLTRFLLTYVHGFGDAPLSLRVAAGIAAHHIVSLRETRDLNTVNGAETLITATNRLVVARPALSLGAAWRILDPLELRLSADYEVSRTLLYPPIDVGGLGLRIGVHYRFL